MIRLGRGNEEKDSQWFRNLIHPKKGDTSAAKKKSTAINGTLPHEWEGGEITREEEKSKKKKRKEIHRP